MPKYTLTDDGRWIENNEIFLFPNYVLDDNGHWVEGELKDELTHKLPYTVAEMLTNGWNRSVS